MKKIYFYLAGFILLIIILFIFINMTKNFKNGNNMDSQEIVDYILNINSYKATITVQVNSNKNTNKYILKQEFNTENGCVQEVLEPSNLEGVKITRKDNTLIIENTNLSLSNILENYQGLEDNCLDLNEFINDFSSNSVSSTEENDTEFIMKTQTENRYSKTKILYINKENLVPVKMEIEDNNQNTTIFIEYNDIELNILSTTI